MASHRHVPIALALVIAIAPLAGAVELESLFLRRPTFPFVTGGGRTTNHALMSSRSEREDALVEQQRALTNGGEAVFPEFFTMPQAALQEIPSGDASVSVFITTGRTGKMCQCAEVRARLSRDTGTQRDLIAEGVVTTSLFPARQGGVAEPIPVVIPIAGEELNGTVVSGEMLTLDLSVRNTCSDGEGRTLNLRYDSRALASRIDFASVAPPVVDDEDDGVCTPCVPGGPTPPECVCLGGCDDDDQCTVDGCDKRTGCFSTPLPFLEGVRCRLERAREILDGAPAAEITPKLQGDRSPLRRKLRKSIRLLDRAEAAIALGAPDRKLERRLKKLRRALTRFMRKVRLFEERDKLGTELRDQLVVEAEDALERSTELPDTP